MAGVLCCGSAGNGRTFTANAEGGSTSLETSNQNAPLGSKMGKFEPQNVHFETTKWQNAARKKWPKSRAVLVLKI